MELYVKKNLSDTPQRCGCAWYISVCVRVHVCVCGCVFVYTDFSTNIKISVIKLSCAFPDCILFLIQTRISVSFALLHAFCLTPYAFSDCILFLRVYTAPDIRQFRIVIRHVCWRMLTYADLCWRLQTRISVSFALSYAFLLAASVNTNQHKNKHLRSVCQQVGIRQSVSASRHKPQLTPTSTRISTLGLCVSK